MNLNPETNPLHHDSPKLKLKKTKIPILGYAGLTVGLIVEIPGFFDGITPS